MIIRFEQRGDIEKISELNLQAFETEANLVDALS
jgi:predicted N-acetyltransferase YhbS